MRKKRICLFCALLLAVLTFSGCAGRKPDLRKVYLYTENFSPPQKENYGYAAELEFEENNAKICISTKDGQALETKLPVETRYAEELFLDMKNEKTGFILSDGSPAAGMMGKMLYITEDGWNTYESVDISSQIKSYPRYFAMLSEKIGYIGCDGRNGSALYRTLDGGRTWSGTAVGENTRVAFAPIEGGDGNYYELTEVRTDDPKRPAYHLYGSGDGMEWESVKLFSLQSEITEYAYADGRICFVCGDGTVYALEP